MVQIKYNISLDNAWFNLSIWGVRKKTAIFARVKKSGPCEYLQIVENRREGKKTIQRVIATVGRVDQKRAKGEIGNLIRSLSRFSEKVLLVLSDRGYANVRATAKKIGPALIFERGGAFPGQQRSFHGR